jgi:hypothetical protein
VWENGSATVGFFDLVSIKLWGFMIIEDIIIVVDNYIVVKPP